MTHRSNRPITLNLDPGHYRYCRCGKSQTFPFCDGAHTSSSDTPKKFTLEFPQTVTICQCGRTQKAPFCDGNHGQNAS